MVIWLIGLSSAGKTTVAQALVQQLRKARPNVVLIDGDIMRDIWGDAPGHDVGGRWINAQRVCRLCRELDRQQIHVVTAILSIFPESQRWNRDNYSSYYEVFLDVPMSILRARDAKGLYAAAEKGALKNVVGIDIEFPRPPNPDLVLGMPEITASPDALARSILAAPAVAQAFA